MVIRVIRDWLLKKKWGYANTHDHDQFIKLGIHAQYRINLRETDLEFFVFSYDDQTETRYYNIAYSEPDFFKRITFYSSKGLCHKDV